MKNNMKHRKHALRKAVTAAVLAGTAFSSFGGVLGTVSSVKADVYNPTISEQDKNELIKLGAGFEEKPDVAALRELLKKFTTESLHGLLVGLDNARTLYEQGEFNLFSGIFKTFDNDNEKDWHHKEFGLNLASVLIQEVRNRLDSKDKLGEIITEKEKKLTKLNDEMDKALKEKKKQRTK